MKILAEMFRCIVGKLGRDIKYQQITQCINFCLTLSLVPSRSLDLSPGPFFHMATKALKHNEYN